MQDREQVDRLIGRGEVMLSNGTKVPTGYDVRVFQHFQTVNGLNGARRHTLDFHTYDCDLDHGGALRPDPASADTMQLVMADRRRLEMFATHYDFERGVTSVTVTGGILPPLEGD